MGEIDYSTDVPDWIPVPGTTKARLISGALTEFGSRGYDAVAVHELAALADVTIGSLYHHFGNKLGLYDTVRADIERRLLDRMEGAVEAGAGIATTLLIGFDYLVRSGFTRLLSEPHPERTQDLIADFVARQADHGGRPVGRLVLAAWRAALSEAATGDASAVRAALDEVLN